MGWMADSSSLFEFIFFEERRVERLRIEYLRLKIATLPLNCRLSCSAGMMTTLPSRRRACL
jgi:hypothetical protein